MTNKEFVEILKSAQAGDNESIEKIILQYMPLVDKHCYINQGMDEDMKQFILMIIVKGISKFKF